MKNAILVDSSFLYALNDKDDEYRDRAIKFARSFRGNFIVPTVALTEVTQLLGKRIGHHSIPTFLKAIVAAPDIYLEPISKDDVQRATEIIEQYPKAKFDFVDCCIFALAERLNISRICTFDIRDFTFFKPTHCEYMELLP